MYRSRYPLFILVSLMLLRGAAGFPQEPAAGGGSSRFAVSHLKGEARNNLVRLAWTDAPAAKGPVYLYRSQTPFSGKNPGSLKNPVRIPYGIQSYIDETDTPGIWYYLLIASDERGERYPFYIPAHNMTSVTVRDAALYRAARQTPEPQAGASKVHSIHAEAREGGISVSYQAEAGGLKTMLYRSITPIRRMEDLLNAAALRSLSGAPYRDYPIAGVPYYYAILLEDDLLSGKAAVFPGVNATVHPVEIAAPPPGSPPAVRAFPLPQLSASALNREALAAGPVSPVFPQAVPLSPQALYLLQDVPSYQAPRRKRKTPRAFTRDLESPLPLGGGETYLLRSIVQGPFTERDWQGAREELLRYLALPRGGGAEGRARYYLGQTYFFTGAFREALFEFLAAQERYPGELADWVQAALRELAGQR